MPSVDDVRVHPSGDRPVPLEPVDRAEVTIVMDNFVDTLLDRRLSPVGRPVRGDHRADGQAFTEANVNRVLPAHCAGGDAGYGRRLVRPSR
jgi:hypothetical protein